VFIQVYTQLKSSNEGGPDPLHHPDSKIDVEPFTPFPVFLCPPFHAVAFSQHPERFAQSVPDVPGRIVQVETDQRNACLQKYRIEQLVSFLPIAHRMGSVIEFYRQ